MNQRDATRILGRDVCSCGKRKDAAASRCRECYRAWIVGRGANSYRARPELVRKGHAVRVECRHCGRSMHPANIDRHEARHRPWDYVDASGDCWEWTGARSNGYGIYRSPDGGMAETAAHRWVWAQLVGPIPAGLQLDHLCRNTTCVNPDHLEPVTPVENRRRGMSPAQRASRLNRCQNGHPRTPENTAAYSTGRQCIPCRTAGRIRRSQQEAAA